MTRFSKLVLGEDGKLVEVEVREIDQSSIAACKHVILVAEHYREDGTCRCNDEAHQEMVDWGYEWDQEIEEWA